ncbi:MAG TPA: ATP-dependent DNA ligase [Candidatus Sulfotelmatobacter sp.]|nr:ATP-dependent DNA ligase [Candidatus Sulfotelmatobacter sp.]
MKEFAKTCDAIAGTTKKLVKTGLVAEYLKSRRADEAAVAAVFFSGRPFPVWEETTLQIGGRWLWRIIAELAGKEEEELSAAYRKHGDLGAVAGEVLPTRSGQGIGILDVERTFRQIAATRGPTEKAAVVRELLSRAAPLEAKYIVKIMTGDLRIGLKESLVEEAIAKAYGSTLAEVQRTNMLLGDIGGGLRLAAEGKLGEARMRLFHPLGSMLASPVESPEEGLSYFTEAEVEDKYDGVRAQAHVSGDEVKIFSRTRDEITESFPELPPALAGLPSEVIFDGEIVAWEYPRGLGESAAVVDEPVSQAGEEKARNLGSARPFSFLQQRLGRKRVSEKMLREVPVAYLVFDILYADGELMLERPLRERAQVLDSLLSAPRKTINHRGHRATQGTFAFEAEMEFNHNRIIRAPVFRASTPEEVEQLFVAARARGNEGLMIKDLASSYTPGKRGKSWLKMKRELATLDVVVTAVEYGHGKRIGVLSDYTFAVWDTKKDRLVNIGKVYSGLTDAEIAEMTTWFLEHTVEDQGFRLVVEPKIVLEVAFNNMMESDRHESGYALRFPRIVRLRPDKLAEDADTIERAREIYEQQKS